ncbi:HTH_48 domain-containing protein [Trichonephila clavipes]|uniref:HTH_48 domain-containing protein n=1 Tax=Trichonephila clavipes TaxID=2585209 RepID=A0A8X6RK73_TRICX|nr:HTH_48 domain-containing protein [Trichonephila clavipes]
MESLGMHIQFLEEKPFLRNVDILFYVLLGHNATEIFAKLQQAYGDSVLSRAQVFRWFRVFSEGRESIEDEPHNGRPSVSKPLKMSLETGILCIQIVT